jgi:predicted nucleotidyltransferase
MELPSYFTDFLNKIRPTSKQRDEMKTGHTTLRSRLNGDKNLAPIIVTDFLQGSYRRSTAIRPKGDNRSDVDIIVVTNLHEDDYPDPKDAMKLFEPFLEKYYKDKWEPQGRSYGIKLSYVELDLVITSAPSEADAEKLKSKSVRYSDELETALDWRLVPSWIPPSERTSYFSQEILRKAASEQEWRLSPLRIPDRDAGKWDDTHPLEQISWTVEKNRRCNCHYINVVKAIKWWKRINDKLPKYPKGYPIEHLIGDCCPDGVTTVAQGVTETLEEIVSKYELHAAAKTVPVLPDHGVPEHNVFHRIDGEDFVAFYDEVCEAAKIAREALDADTVKKSADKWRELFGDKFPEAPDDDGRSDNKSGGNGPYIRKGYTEREEVSEPLPERYA